MKKFLSVFLAFLMLLALFTGCAKEGQTPTGDTGPTYTAGATTDLGDDDVSYGNDYDDLGAYDGYFEQEDTDYEITFLSGTEGCYTVEGNTLTFTAVSEDSTYAISGQFSGNIVIDIGDEYDFELELCGFSLVSSTECPIAVLSGDEVSIKAKKDYVNYIYDTREAVDSSQDGVFSGAIHSKVDLQICGKGALTVVSENNNGIHTKKDLKVKNLTLSVICVDNALKGNDSVTVKDATTTLIATQGDCIKTSDTDISSKGNQRGTVTVSGGTHELYAACDGIDAAYNVVIENSEDTETVLNIYTDKYSNYSEEITAVDSNQYYVSFHSDAYTYSVIYYNSETGETCQVEVEYDSKSSDGPNTYYYYAFPIMTGYDKIEIIFYYNGEVALDTDYLEINSAYDTIKFTAYGQGYVRYNWTNRSTTSNGSSWGRPGGGGGMNDSGNTDKGDYSTKGLKAGNELIINAGTISIKSYDDCLHADQGTTLENGETSLGNVTVNGGVLTLYTNDDGIHADSLLTVNDGTVCITNSYEGLEGTNIVINGGYISVAAKDDGVNGTATTGTAIEINGGYLYVNCTGDGLDSNSNDNKTKYEGIIFNGGNVVIIANSSGNSSIDTENGYTYNGGTILAIGVGGGMGGGMMGGGMTDEASNCANFSSVATESTMKLSSGSYLAVTLSGSTVLTIQMPVSMSSAQVIFLAGTTGAKFSTATSSSVTLDDNGVCWHTL